MCKLVCLLWRQQEPASQLQREPCAAQTQQAACMAAPRHCDSCLHIIAAVFQYCNAHIASQMCEAANTDVIFDSGVVFRNAV